MQSKCSILYRLYLLHSYSYKIIFLISTYLPIIKLFSPTWRTSNRLCIKPYKSYIKSTIFKHREYWIFFYIFLFFKNIYPWYSSHSIRVSMDTVAFQGGRLGGRAGMVYEAQFWRRELEARLEWIGRSLDSCKSDGRQDPQHSFILKNVCKFCVLLSNIGVVLRT